jgi:MYXO-CTERM domain-containing protein
MRRIALALLLLACTTPRGESTSTTRGAIQGGSLDSANKFAIAILDDSNAVCSGTLIAPNLVLTARHCIAGGGSDPIDCATDEFESPRVASTYRVTAATTADYDTAEYTVTKILVPSDSLFCGNDIALAIIDTNVTGTVAEPMLDPPDLDAITAIGYGTTGPYENDDGKRRKLADVEITCVPGIPKRDCDLSSYEMAKTEIAAGGGLCDGDSGSGAFVPASVASGKPIVVGVLSRAADDGESCLDAIYARTDAFKKFLVDGATEASQDGGYALPSWAKPAGTTPTPPVDETGETPETPPEGESATPSVKPGTTTTTESGCAAAPGNPRDFWPIALAALALIKRRRRSHSPV